MAKNKTYFADAMSKVFNSLIENICGKLFGKLIERSNVRVLYGSQIDTVYIMPKFDKTLRDFVEPVGWVQTCFGLTIGQTPYLIVVDPDRRA